MRRRLPYRCLKVFNSLTTENFFRSRNVAENADRVMTICAQCAGNQQKAVDVPVIGTEFPIKSNSFHKRKNCGYEGRVVSAILGVVVLLLNRSFSVLDAQTE